MKAITIIILFMMFHSVYSIAQEPLKYEAVIKIDTITEEKELLMRLKIWLDDAFVNKDEVIQILDEEEGQIIGRGNISYNSNIYIGSDGTNGHVDFRFKIEIKKGRYRYEFYDFMHDGSLGNDYDFGIITTDSICPKHIKGSPEKWTNKVWNDIRQQTDDKMQLVISSLIRYMAIPTKSGDDTW